MRTDGGRLEFSIGIDTRGLAQSADEARRIFTSIGDAGERQGGLIDRAMARARAAVENAFSFHSAVGFAREVINVRREVEGLEISFRTLLGSQAEADRLFGSLRTFAAETPMDLKDLAKGAQTMLGFGMAGEEVMPILRAIGDISMGNREKFAALTLAFSQASSTGKLMGQDLMQMINAGFNPLAQISERTGQSIGALKAQMAAGGISAAQLKEAFLGAAAAGGRYHGMLEAQSQGLGGSIAKLQGLYSDMLNDIGAASQGMVTKAIHGAGALVQHYREVGVAIGGLVGSYGALKAAAAALEGYRRAGAALEARKETEALEGLIGAQGRARLAQEGLQRGTKEYAEGVARLAWEQRAAGEAELARARAAVKGAAAAAAAKREEFVAAKAREAAARRELAAAVQGGNARAAETARRKVETAAVARQTAAQEWLNASKRKEAAATATAAAARRVSSTAAAMETAAAGASAAAHGVLARAKDIATRAALKLNAALMANPYVVAAAAIAALGYGIYKLATYQTAAEAAQRRLNKAFAEGEASAAAEQVKVDTLFGTLEGATKGTREYEEAKRAILSQYGDYLKGLGDEETALNDVAAAYEAVSAGVRKAALAKARESYIAKEQEEYQKSYTKTLTKLRDELQARFGAREGSAMLAELRPVLEGRKRLDEIREETQRRVESLNKEKVKGGVLGNAAVTYVANRVKELVAEGTATTRALSDAVAAANEMFGGAGEAPTKRVEVKPAAAGAGDAGGDAEKERRAAEEEAARLAREAAARRAQLDAIKKEQADAAREAGFAVEQARIDGLEEGFEKEMAALKLQHERLEAENDKRRDRMVEEERKRRALEGDAAGAAAVSKDTLPKKQQDILQAYQDINDKELARGQQAALARVLEGVMTYQQRRLQVEAEFAERRKALYEEDGATLRAGATEGNAEELARAQEEALAAVDEQYAQRDVTYRAWMDTLAQYTVDGLQEMLTEAEAVLAAAEKAGGGKGDGLAVAKAKVNRLKKEVAQKKAEAEQQDKNAAKTKAAGEAWKDLAGTLSLAGRGFKELGNAVGGSVGRMLSGVGEVSEMASGVIGNIEALVQASSTAMTTAVGGAATAMSTMEKGSVILTIISTLVQIGMKIASLFDDTEEINKRIAQRQAAIDALQWEVDNRDVADLFQREGEEFARVLREAVNAGIVRGNDMAGAYFRDNFHRIHTEFMGLRRVNREAQREFERGYAEAAARAAKAIAERMGSVKYSDTRVAGLDKYKNVQRDLEAMSREMMERERQMREERGKGKKQDGEQIAKWEQENRDLAARMARMVGEAMEDILGGSANDLAGQLGDALFEAFRSGEDAAEAWGKKVDDIVADITKRMLIKQFLEKPMAELVNRWQSKAFRGGRFDAEAAMDGARDFRAGMLQMLTAGKEMTRYATEVMPEVFNQIGREAGGRSAAARGIATASQESVNELNGRMTAVQGHTYAIMQGTAVLQSVCGGILEGVRDVARAASSMDARLERVEHDGYQARRALERMQSEGVRVRG